MNNDSRYISVNTYHPVHSGIPKTAIELMYHMHGIYQPGAEPLFTLCWINERPAVMVGIVPKADQPLFYDGVMLYDVVLPQINGDVNASGTDFEIRLWHAEPERFVRAVQQLREELGDRSQLKSI